MIHYFQQGGFMMWPLLLLSVIGLAVIIERILYLNDISSRHRKMLKGLSVCFDKKDIEGAYKVCRSSLQTPLSVILLVGMEKIKQGREAVDNAMGEVSLEQVPLIEKRLAVLSTIASISTLLGFTGTVIGMIKAFQSIAREGISSPTIVASGISSALITTATGLMIAIPAIVFYQYLSHRTDREITVIEKYSKELLSVFE